MFLIKKYNYTNLKKIHTCQHFMVKLVYKFKKKMLFYNLKVGNLWIQFLLLKLKELYKNNW